MRKVATRMLALLLATAAAVLAQDASGTTKAAGGGGLGRLINGGNGTQLDETLAVPALVNATIGAGAAPADASTAALAPPALVDGVLPSLSASSMFGGGAGDTTAPGTAAVEPSASVPLPPAVGVGDAVGAGEPSAVLEQEVAEAKAERSIADDLLELKDVRNPVLSRPLGHLRRRRCDRRRKRGLLPSESALQFLPLRLPELFRPRGDLMAWQIAVSA